MGKVGGTIDRRFGENDPTLDPEAKALARMARIRAKQLGRRGSFALGGAAAPAPRLLPSRRQARLGRRSAPRLTAAPPPQPPRAADDDDGEDDGGGEVLTHMGRSLAEMDDFSDPSIEVCAVICCLGGFLAPLALRRRTTSARRPGPPATARVDAASPPFLRAGLR